MDKFIAPIAAFATKVAPIASLLGTVATVASVASTLSKKSPSETAPAPMQANATQAEVSTAQRTAEDTARRRALAAAGKQSNILTSPTGIAAIQRNVVGG